MENREIKRIHMVGIGGIGMSALAQYFLAHGALVTGSDRDESPTTHLLRDRGVTVLVIGHYGSSVPEDADIIVYSDAVPADNPERVKGRELRIPELTYFEALGAAAEGRPPFADGYGGQKPSSAQGFGGAKRVVAVSGTNGKTTTTAMLGKVLEDCGADPTVVVGSIASQWKSNFRNGASDIFVVEACEYRRHFLTFRPEVLVITNIEYDHTDYFTSLDDVISAFNEAARRAKLVIAKMSDANVAKALAGIEVPIVDYSDVPVPELLVPGEFNTENARAAKAAARAIAPELNESAVDASLAQYRGTWRRFEYKGTTPGGAKLYDDYAHHPTAIALTIDAARGMFPGKKIAVAFHPHLYSRTRDLWDGFAEALAKPDLAYILPVYAARETPDPTFDHAALAKAANVNGGNAFPVNSIEDAAGKLAELGPEYVAFTMGAGDVYKAADMIASVA